MGDAEGDFLDGLNPLERALIKRVLELFDEEKRTADGIEEGVRNMRGEGKFYPVYKERVLERYRILLEYNALLNISKDILIKDCGSQHKKFIEEQLADYDGFMKKVLGIG